MRETQAIIERINRVNSTHQQLELSVDTSLRKIKPGQTVLVRVGESLNPYLREQWWPVNVQRGKLIIERPLRTTYTPGQVVSLLGIVGQPYRFRPNLRNVLLMAHDTPPTPLMMTTEWLLVNDVSVTLVLLGKAADYQTTHLPPEVEIITGDADLNWSNRVTTVGWADQIFVVVAREGEAERFRAIWRLLHELRADVPALYTFGVFRPIMPCGVGACQACMVAMEGGAKLACTDGPALDLSKVIIP